MKPMTGTTNHQGVTKEFPIVLFHQFYEILKQRFGWHSEIGEKDHIYELWVFPPWNISLLGSLGSMQHHFRQYATHGIGNMMIYGDSRIGFHFNPRNCSSLILKRFKPIWLWRSCRKSYPDISVEKRWWVITLYFPRFLYWTSQMTVPYPYRTKITISNLVLAPSPSYIMRCFCSPSITIPVRLRDGSRNLPKDSKNFAHFVLLEDGRYLYRCIHV
jgi:hypothetical protein